VNRVVAVIVGTLILLLVGFTLGRRPVGRLNEQVKQLTATHEQMVGDLQDRAALAEARGYLWQARARLLIASHDVEMNNFGQAGQQVTAASELLTRAAAVEGMHLDLGAVQEMIAAAAKAVSALDPAARDPLFRSSQMLGTLLDQDRA